MSNPGISKIEFAADSPLEICPRTPWDRFVADSPLEETGFEPVWGFSCQVMFLVCCRFFVRSGKAVPRPVACDQVRGARGWGQGTETLAKLGGLPLAALVFGSALRPEHAQR
jgi:hypothetical protein